MACGFSSQKMSKHEREVFPEYSSPKSKSMQYIKLRNHVCAKWMEDITRFLTKEEACHGLSEQQIAIVGYIYDYLNRYGFINFGKLKPRKYTLAEMKIRTENSKKTIVVCGAGIAGIAAANRLKSFGYNVVVLEAKNRLGGRIWTHNFGNTFVDIGASIITGLG
jgi:lysine-specific histone demethylase 1